MGKCGGFSKDRVIILSDKKIDVFRVRKKNPGQLLEHGKKNLNVPLLPTFPFWVQRKSETLMR